MSVELADRKQGTIPKGTYDALVTGVATVRRKDRHHVLRVIVRTLGKDTDLVIWQGLADADKDDPFDLDHRQRQAVRRFAEKLQIRLGDDLSTLPLALSDMAGAGVIVSAKVSQTRVGQRVTLSIPLPVVLDAVAPVPAGVTDAAVLAQNAHEKVLQGLGAVRLGLARASEGCYLLHQSEGWLALGYESLGEYLAAPEVTLSRSTFYALSGIWQRYVLDGGLEATRLGGADRTKLEVPLPALGEGLVSAEQAVADATSMTREDLKARYAELLGEEPNGNGKVSRRQDVQITDEMVDRGAEAAAGLWPGASTSEACRGMASAVLSAAFGVEVAV